MGARILIIDDNPANLELMTYLLSAYGYTIFAAEDGYGGILTAKQEHPDLIVCDVQLPDIDGFEVALCLKDDPALSSIPLIAVTALAMVGDRDRVLAAGFDGYLTKPIDPEKFVQQMEAFIPIHQRTSAPPAALTPAEPERAAVCGRFTILVVDNLPVNRELARSILLPSGYKVIDTDNMVLGLALARESGCDLILSDVSMPHGSGFDFLEAVRADPQLRPIPFILITSTLLDNKDRDRGLALGANRFLRRPIEPEALLDEIRECLGEKGSN